MKFKFSLVLIFAIFSGYSCSNVEWKGEYHEGLARVRVIGYPDVPHKYGYVDTNNNPIIPPEFLEAGDFSEGLATVRLYGENKNWPGKHYPAHLHPVGYIDKFGKIVIQPQFLYAQKFSEGLAAFTELKPHLGPPGAYSDAHKEGYVDATGKVVIPAVFEEAYPFQEGVAFVRPDKKPEYVKGIRKVPVGIPGSMWYLPAGPYTEKVNTGKFGLIDRTGAYVIEPILEETSWGFKDGKASVKQNGTWVLIDKHGKILGTDPPK